MTVPEGEVDVLPDLIERSLFDEEQLGKMRAASRSIARPGAAKSIASALLEAA